MSFPLFGDDTALDTYAANGPEEFFAVASESFFVDQADSAQYELQDILDPQGWTLLNLGSLAPLALLGAALSIIRYTDCIAKDAPIKPW